MCVNADLLRDFLKLSLSDRNYADVSFVYQNKVRVHRSPRNVITPAWWWDQVSLLDICQKWEGLSSFYFVIDPGAIFFVVPYFSVGYLTSRPGLGRPTRPGGVRGRGTTHSVTVTVNSIQCRIEASSIYCKYRKYRKYRSIVDTWLGIGIDAAQVPRYLQSIEYRPGTNLKEYSILQLLCPCSFR